MTDFAIQTVTPPGYRELIAKLKLPEHKHVEVAEQLNLTIEAIAIYTHKRSDDNARYVTGSLSKLDTMIRWRRSDITNPGDHEVWLLQHYAAEWLDDYFVTLLNAEAILRAADRINGK